MKILITTDLYAVKTNGVVTSVNNLRQVLTSRGHDVRILTVSDSTHSYSADGVYYIRSIPIGIYPGVRMPLSLNHRYIKELIGWAPDIIHSQCEFFTLGYAKHISRVCSVPIVHTYHTLYEQYAAYVIPGKRLSRYVVRTVSRLRLKCVEHVVVPTEKVRTALLSYGVEKPVSVIPSGIDLDMLSSGPSELERLELRRRLGISQGEIVLINLGRLGTEKNLGELIDYFAAASAGYHHLRFLIVGDGPARQSLQEKAFASGVSDKVIFTGMISPEQVGAHYRLADIFVSASTSETQGLTYIEAAACSLPLLCRADPCLDGVLEHGVNGYTYTDEADFHSALSHLLRDRDFLRSAARRSRQIAGGYSKESFAGRIEELYMQLV